MWNILKEMLRQTIRDKLLWAGGIYLLAMLCTTLHEEITSTSTGSEIAVLVLQLFSIMLPISTGIITARVCGADLRDKTANYELLFGKKRSQVYFGRFFAALTVSVLFTAVIILPAPCITFLKNGWGGCFSPGNTLLHFGMIFPVIFRITCFITALTFLCRNDILPAVITLTGSLTLHIGAFLMKDAGCELSWQSSVTELLHLLDFSNTTTGYFEDKDITVYKAFLSTGGIIRMLLTSFGIGLGWLFGGFALFRRQDIS